MSLKMLSLAAFYFNVRYQISAYMFVWALGCMLVVLYMTFEGNSSVKVCIELFSEIVEIALNPSTNLPDT